MMEITETPQQRVKNNMLFPFLMLGNEGSRKHLAAIKRRNKTVFIVGSAISAYAPSGLTTGMAVTKNIAAHLVPDDTPHCALVRYVISQSAFEHIFEHHPAHAQLRSNVANYYSTAKHNAVHSVFAKMLDKDECNAIITPNYDTGIEQAYFQSTNRHIYVWHPGKCEQSSDTSEAWNTSHQLIKIHGCASSPDSLVMTLSDESKMNPTTSKRLKETLEGADLVIIGYSGLDFEICSELMSARVNSLTWNILNLSSATPNARAVLKHFPDSGTFIIGDMIELLADMGYKDARKTSRVFIEDSLCTQIMKELNERQTLEWAANLLVQLSCPHAAIHIAKKIRDRHCVKTGITIICDAMYHLGHHRDALALRRNLREKYLEVNSDEYWKSFLNDIGNIWTIGKLFDARQALLKFEMDYKKQMHNDLPEPFSYSLLWIDVLLQSAIIKIPIFGIFLQRITINSLSEKLKLLFSHHINSGNWGFINLIHDKADKLNIPQSRYSDLDVEIPSAGEGFKHMGNIVGQMTSCNDVLPSDRRRLVNLGRKLGLMPGCAIALSLLAKHPKQFKPLHSKLYWSSIFGCQFTLVKKTQSIATYLYNRNISRYFSLKAK